MVAEQFLNRANILKRKFSKKKQIQVAEFVYKWEAF